MKKTKPEVRYLHDMKKVLYDKKWAKNAPNFELYYIYRGLKTKNGIRYDITLIPARMLGEEFVKTKGHYHFGSYGELYKILAGESIFLIQKRVASKLQKRFGEVKDVYFVKAKNGEYILIPPQYGHTIINPSSTALKIANWASKDCQSDYKSIERKRGFCYYYTKSGSRATAKGEEENLFSSPWVKNKAYKQIPKLRFERPLKSMPKNLSFLYAQ